MRNWMMDEATIMKHTENAIIGELKTLLQDNNNVMTANYWIDNTHNVFAMITEGSDNEKGLDIRVELYDSREEQIGDLYIYGTDMCKKSLEAVVKDIVKKYYAE